MKNEKTYFPNYAGIGNVDAELTKELEKAGIEVHKWSSIKVQGEVDTHVIGVVHQWGFKRAWRYWVADGPGIPPEIAEELYKNFGSQVRVAGHGNGPSPLEWFNGFAVGMYHIDTTEGLKALANTIKDIYIEPKNE